MPDEKKSFEEYLRSENAKAHIDFRIRTIRGPNNELDFYIHPDGADGDTLDFEVRGNELVRLEMGAGSRVPQST
jgi:hypothetical protein